jgi:hypothetical protein
MFAAAFFALLIQTPEPPKKYKSGDMTRPRPVVVTPGENGKPPSDAVILFDGKNLDAWKKSGKPKDGNDKPGWKIDSGYFEVVPRTGGIQTNETFGDCQIHLEWATPSEVKGTGQGRGNSGVHLGGFGEIQVLDSFENDTYPDGQASALYRKTPPLVNASRKPGEWQTYDIIVHLPKTDADGKVVKPGLVTVMHNGVVVHHAFEFRNKINPFNLALSDHGNPVRYRNIWIRKLKGYDEK